MMFYLSQSFLVISHQLLYPTHPAILLKSQTSSQPTAFWLPLNRRCKYFARRWRPFGRADDKGKHVQSDAEKTKENRFRWLDIKTKEWVKECTINMDFHSSLGRFFKISKIIQSWSTVPEVHCSAYPSENLQRHHAVGIFLQDLNVPSSCGLSSFEGTIWHIETGDNKRSSCDPEKGGLVAWYSR